ncbi:hypothetical protein LXL04_011239 [Taraxacum kok-saghyz]
MMLRSSSTPLLGSLLPSQSPNHHHHHHETTLHPHKPPSINKFSFPSPGSQHFTPLSCSSSPISPSFGTDRIRRAQSDGNLESLMSSGGGDSNDDEFSFFNHPEKLSRIHNSLLESIPSFSYQNSKFKSDEDDSSDNEDQEQDEFRKFSGFSVENNVSSLNKQMGFRDLAIKHDTSEANSQMYLAKGIEVDAGFGCGGGGDNYNVEEHYKKMVNENPGNPLFLGNYAKFLYQSKKDLEGAEEYYSRVCLCTCFLFSLILLFAPGFVYAWKSMDKKKGFCWQKDRFALVCSAHEGFNSLRLTGVSCRD